MRPGVALYGANPTPGKKNPMRPAVELKGRILQVRNIKKGDTVGYGAAYVAARPTRLAIIAVGYADGYARAAGAAKGKPAAEVIIAGRRCPLAGRISMDLVTLDVTDVPEPEAQTGALVEVLGPHTSPDDLAEHARTNAYEVMTSLGHRYARVYVDRPESIE